MTLALTILKLFWKPLAWLLGAFGIYAAGSIHRVQREQIKDLEQYRKTREAIDDADIPSDDPAVLRDWLRERGKRDGNL